MKMTMKDYPDHDRPREKLLTKGPTALTDTELLAILVQNGHAGGSALDLARELLSTGNGQLSALARQNIREIMRIKGLGQAKASLLVAAWELGRRRHAAESLEKPQVRDSAGVASFLRAHFQDLAHEVFAVVYLNRANRILHWEVVSSGGITGTVADPRIILRRALEAGAVGLILCHNHPSGSLRPSLADQDLTNKIKEAARFLDIKVLDHVIVSNEGYFSFADEGLL
jgi:DNA repair protein RadC